MEVSPAMDRTIRAAFRILLKGGGGGGGGKIAVSAYQGGQALHAVHYNIYINEMLKGVTKSCGGSPPPLLNHCQQHIHNIFPHFLTLMHWRASFWTLEQLQ